MQGSPKWFLMGNFIIQDQWENPRTRWENTVWKDTSQILGILGWKK